MLTIKADDVFMCTVFSFIGFHLVESVNHEFVHTRRDTLFIHRCINPKDQADLMFMTKND